MKPKRLFIYFCIHEAFSFIKCKPKIVFSILFCYYILTYNNTFAQVGYITTIAGTGAAGYSGNGGLATLAKLESPGWIAIDDTGNIYISDNGNSKIRKIDLNGVINNFASLNSPFVLTFDKKGNLYATSSPPTNVVVKIDKQGNMTNFAGTGTAGYSGNGGAATQATLHSAAAIAFDKHGNLYISDDLNYRIRKVDTFGIINNFAGNGVAGYSGDSGLAINASFKGITSIVVDTNDNVFFSDINGSIRVVDKFGIINTYVGRSYTLDSPDTIARDSCGVWDPIGLSIDSLGQVYYVDQITARVKQINKNDTVYTITGLHVPGYNGDNIPAIQAQIGHAGGTLFDKYGNLYIADVDNNRVRKITYYYPTAIKQFTDNSNQLSVYPNPSQNSFQVAVSNEQITELKITDMLGKEVRCEILDMRQDKTQIDVSNLPNGVYFIKVKTSAEVLTKKIIVQH